MKTKFLYLLFFVLGLTKYSSSQIVNGFLLDLKKQVYIGGKSFDYCNSSSIQRYFIPIDSLGTSLNETEVDSSYYFKLRKLNGYRLYYYSSKEETIVFSQYCCHDSVSSVFVPDSMQISVAFESKEYLAQVSISYCSLDIRCNCINDYHLFPDGWNTERILVAQSAVSSKPDFYYLQRLIGNILKSNPHFRLIPYTSKLQYR